MWRRNSAHACRGGHPHAKPGSGKSQRPGRHGRRYRDPGNIRERKAGVQGRETRPGKRPETGNCPFTGKGMPGRCVARERGRRQTGKRQTGRREHIWAGGKPKNGAHMVGRVRKIGAEKETDKAGKGAAGKKYRPTPASAGHRTVLCVYTDRRIKFHGQFCG